MDSDMTKKIIVTDICSSSSEKTVKDFFLFCGKIKEFELTKDKNCDKQIAHITFERDTAARTATMLSNAFIGDSQITVKSACDPSSDECLDDGEGCDGQEGKPKLMIFAEILAAGYQLSVPILEKGAQFDAKYGFSALFKQYWSFIQAYCLALDEKYKVYDTVTAKAHELDVKYSVQEKVYQVQDKALGSSPGKLFVDLYANATKQVNEIRCMVKRIADEKKSAHADHTIEAH